MKQLWRVGFALQSAFVVALSYGAYTGNLPTNLPWFPQADKLGHALFIGLLAFFLDGALGHRRLRPRSPFPRLAPVLVLAVAGVEEFLQRLSPRRDSSLLDYAADVVGVAFFCWLSVRVDEAVRSPRRGPTSSGSGTAPPAPAG